jgi:hypothetical protein
MTAGIFAKAPDGESVWGDTRVIVFTYTGSAAYNPGGDVPSVGLRSIRGAMMMGQNTASLGVIPVWNSQTGKLQLFWTGAALSGALAEFSGNASTFVYTMLFVSLDD